MTPLGTLALLALIGVGGAQTDCSYLDLLTHLNLTASSALQTAMRPVRNWTTVTLVQLDMLIYGILGVDEKSQILTTHVWILMRWTNEFLSWDPSSFCGIDKMYIPRSGLWIPDVFIIEDASDSGSISDSPVVSLSPDGLLQANRRQRLTSTCLFVLVLFPFDTQRCNITFTTMTSDANSITLGTVFTEAQLTSTSDRYMVTEGEWELKKLEVTYLSGNRTTGFPSHLVYTITICRKPLLYVIIFIVPLFYFVLLDVASFFINEARGEKLSFKVTVLLSISVLLLILKDLLPSTEAGLPMIAMYCGVVFGLVGISVLEAMLVSFLIDLDGYCKSPEAPDGAQEVVQQEVVQQEVVQLEVVQLEVDFHSEPDGAEGTPEKSPPPPGRLDDLLRLILEEVKKAGQEARGRDKDEKRPKRYRRLAEIIDSVFFVFYFLCTFGFLTYMNIKWITQIM